VSYETVSWCTLTEPLHACSGGEHRVSCTSVWAISSDGTDRPLRGCCSDGSERAATMVFWCTLTKPLSGTLAGHLALLDVSEFDTGCSGEIPCVPAYSALRLSLAWRYGTAPPAPHQCEYMIDYNLYVEKSFSNLPTQHLPLI
jgi:hypothetical protein